MSTLRGHVLKGPFCQSERLLPAFNHLPAIRLGPPPHSNTFQVPSNSIQTLVLNIACIHKLPFDFPSEQVSFVLRAHLAQPGDPASQAKPYLARLWSFDAPHMRIAANNKWKPSTSPAGGSTPMHYAFNGTFGALPQGNPDGYL